ncbi:unnamed protein product [Diabrotica balteata]|uniref:Uncharacterized protein n=1 Tax=Diabrotica balteata TaxID=107213 RepID=A0A9N9T0W0_DIABA|nr:unnamed protein product [Diabrotica balteata]
MSIQEKVLMKKIKKREKQKLKFVQKKESEKSKEESEEPEKVKVENGLKRLQSNDEGPSKSKYVSFIYLLIF